MLKEILSLKNQMSLGEKFFQINWIFVFLICAIAAVGFVALYSAANGNVDPWASRHAVRFGVGMVGFFIVAFIDIRLWLRFAYWIYGLIFLLLIAVELKGHIGMGAQRWIDLGFIRLQPSEIMKIGVILALARFFNGASLEDVKHPTFLIKPILLAAAPTALVMLQPDLGTALMILMGASAIFLLAGVSYWMFGVVIGGGYCQPADPVDSDAWLSEKTDHDLP